MATCPKTLLECAKEALIVHLARGFQRNAHTGRYPLPDALIKHLDHVTKEIWAILRLLLDQDDAEQICSKACCDVDEAFTYWIKLWHVQLLMGPWDCSSKFQTAQCDRDAHPSKVLLSPDVVVTPFTEPRSGCYKLKQDPLSVRWGGSIIWHDRITQELAGLIQNSVQYIRHFRHPGQRMTVELFRLFYTQNCCYVDGLTGGGGGGGGGGPLYGCCGGLRFRPAAWADQAIWQNSQMLCLTPYSTKNHRLLAQLGQHAPLSANDAAEVMLAAPSLSQRKRSFCTQMALCDYGGVGGACELCLMDAWTTNGTLRDVRLLYRAFDPVNKFHTLDNDIGQHVPYVKLLCVPEVEVMLNGYHVSNDKIPPPRDTRFGPLAATVCFDNDRCIFATTL